MKFPFARSGQVHIVKSLLQMAVYAYLVLVLWGLPLYASDGYQKIATDKAQLFARFADPLAKCALLLCAAWLFARFWDGSLRINMRQYVSRLGWPVIFAVCYGVSILISFLVSPYRPDAIWGTNGWYLGLVPQEISLLFGILLMKMARDGDLSDRAVRGIAAGAFAVNLFVFLLALINRFGIYLPGFSGRDSSKLSTFGNMNWYCGYLVPVLFLAVGILARGSRQKIVLLFAFLGSISLITQGSASGLMALFGVLYVLCLFAICGHLEPERVLLAAFLPMLGGCLVYLLQLAFPLNLMNPEIALFCGSARVLIGTGIIGLLLLLLRWRKIRRGAPGAAGTNSPESAAPATASNTAGNAGKPGKCRKLLLAGVLLVTFVLLFAGLFLLIGNTMSGGRLLAGTILQGLGQEPGDPLYFGPDWGSLRGASWRIGLRIWQEQDLLHRLFGVGPDAFSFYLNRDAGLFTQAMTLSAFGSMRLTNAHCELLTILVNHGVFGCVTFLLLMGSSLYRLLLGKSKLGFACGLSLLAYCLNQIASFETLVNFPLILLIWGYGVGKNERDSIG